MRYSVILLDLDGTLLDFEAAERHGIEQICERHGYPYNIEILNCYAAINRALWAALERKEIDLSGVLGVRFEQWINACGFEGDGAELEQEYRAFLATDFTLIDGAHDLCAALAPNARLFIASNGVSMTQRQRVAGSGLAPFIQDFFISQEIGAQKPSPEYFNHIIQAVNCDCSEILMVGDSLSSDILGGNRSGIDTCWYNPKGLPNHTDAKPDYIIRNLNELLDIV